MKSDEIGCNWIMTNIPRCEKCSYEMSAIYKDTQNLEWVCQQCMFSSLPHLKVGHFWTKK